MKFPFVSVIIVNYNGVRYLPACLDALNLQTYPKESFEVIVSDNNSTDGSRDFITSKYPRVKLLKNDDNLGFAKGNNVAIQQTKSEFVILLNNDTAPNPNWLSEMVAVA